MKRDHVKAIYMVVFCAFSLICGALVWKSIQTSARKRTLAAGSELPDAEFFQLSGQPFPIRNISAEKKVLLFFQTTCEHCQMNLMTLDKSELPPKGTLFFVSGENQDKITEFVQRLPNLVRHGVFLEDRNNAYLEHFGSSAIPNLFVYDDNGLIKNFRGGVTPSVLLSMIKGPNAATYTSQ